MKRYVEIIKYAFWGGVSTVINLVLLFALLKFTKIYYLLANIISYVVAVIVNYVTNKRYVFNSSKNAKEEFVKFIFVRLVSLMLDTVCYYILVDILGGNKYLSKILLSMVIIIATYIINKLFVFKKNTE